MKTSFRITFDSKSAIVNFLKEDKKGRLPWKCANDSLVLEFDIDPDSELKPWSAWFLDDLIDQRSPYFANSTLSNLSFCLRHGSEIPRKQRLLLAAALDRVSEGNLGDNVNCVKFLYGPQKKPGKPERDTLEKFHIYHLIEFSYAGHGRYRSSQSKGVGAYEVAQRLLEFEHIYLDESELKRVRNQVRDKMSEDLNYTLQFVHYLIQKGHKVNQVL